MYSLKDFGSFMIPGREVKLANQPKKIVKRNENVSIEIDPNGTYSIENMYVQYFIPENSMGNVVFVHGGGQCGNIWEATPDGRKGWLHWFLKKNYSVYIIDTIERGRSGWCSIPNTWDGEPELRTSERTWNAFRVGSEENYEEKKAYEGQQFPVEHFDKLVCYNVPRWNCNVVNSGNALSSLIDLIDQKCFIIAHSQGCEIAMRAVEIKPEKIKKIILIEPASFYKTQPLHEYNLDLLILFGDHIAKSKLWTSMTDLTIKYKNDLIENGLNVNLLKLPDAKIFGNSHVLMLDKNNNEIASLIISWMENEKNAYSLQSKL